MKYKLSDDFILVNTVKLFRIESLKNFGNVKIGDKGGYIASEKNLSQEGNAWVSGDAEVSGNARVFENAEVSGDARVFENAEVSGNAWVSGTAEVFGQ